jgi:hypothetical protein
LHHWALNADPSTIRQWLDSFARRVPCGQCRRHWLEEVKSFPPPTQSGADLFAWTVERHNNVNRRLGKALLVLEDARRQWTAQDLNGYFDAVWCINLDADTQRWSDFQRQLAECDWPFGAVTRLSAVRGDTVGVPVHFHQGGGAWGCLQSHRRVLEMSLMAGHQRILVLEDDADLRSGFGPAARKFLRDLGDEPWDCLMLGGQHMAPPTHYKAGVVRASLPGGIQRTHCLAFSRAFMRELYRHWSGPLDQHCDWALGPLAARFRTFAPERFIVGQRGGPSRITGSQKPAEWWNPPPADLPVVWLRAPRSVLEATRDIFHAGNRRDDQGACVGLAPIFNSPSKRTSQRRVAMLKKWIAMIQWEVESRGDGSVCTIWHPTADAEIIRAAAGNELVEIQVQTEEEARRAKFNIGGNHPSAGSMIADMEPLQAAIRLSAP